MCFLELRNRTPLSDVPVYNCVFFLQGSILYALQAYTRRGHCWKTGPTRGWWGTLKRSQHSPTPSFNQFWRTLCSWGETQVKTSMVLPHYSLSEMRFFLTLFFAGDDVFRTNTTAIKTANAFKRSNTVEICGPMLFLDIAHTEKLIPTETQLTLELTLQNAK